MKIKLIAAAFLLVMLTSCSSVYLNHPGTNPGVHNETVLSKATGKSIQNANLPLEQLTSRKVFVQIFSKNKGRIYSLISPILQDNGIKTVSKLEDANMILRISEKVAGVNLVRKSYWWWWPAPPMAYINESNSSQAKTEILFEFIDLRTDRTTFSKVSSSGREYSDITRDRVFYFMVFRINLENFWAEE